MPRYETEILRAARAVARYQRVIRELKRRLKEAQRELRIEQRTLRTLAQATAPDIAPSQLFGDVSYKRPTGTDA